MFWPIKARNSQRKERSRQRRRSELRNNTGRRSRFETLEVRQVLTGVVEVIAPMGLGTLTLEGDSSNNHVQIAQTKNAFEFRVQGKEGTLLKVNGSLVTEAVVNFINKDITIDLKHGDDWFKFAGQEGGGNSHVGHSLHIINDNGSNMNDIMMVEIMADLTVEKKMGVWSYTELSVTDTIVNGNTLIDNGTSSEYAMMGMTGEMMSMTGDMKGGDSKTLIVNSQLRGMEMTEHRMSPAALAITNGEGFDIVDIRDTKVGVNNMGDTRIQNGNGGSRTTFTSENGLGNTLYGNLDIINGDNFIGVNVYDQVIFNKTNVWKSTMINNKDGDTMVVIQDNSILGSYVGLVTMSPMGFTEAGKVKIMNDHGIDTFLMKDSEAPYGLVIDHATTRNIPGHGMDPPSDAMQYYGSRTDIIDSDIGTNLKSDGGVRIWGDDKDDVINITNSWIGGKNGISIETFDGNDDVFLFLKEHPVSMIWIDVAKGMDHVRLEEVHVTNATMILMGESGQDLLEILKMSNLQGMNSFDGGHGLEDTFLRDLDVMIDSPIITGFEHVDINQAP